MWLTARCELKYIVEHRKGCLPAALFGFDWPVPGQLEALPPNHRGISGQMKNVVRGGSDAAIVIYAR
jgi:hypothetical protein